NGHRYLAVAVNGDYLFGTGTTAGAEPTWCTDSAGCETPANGTDGVKYKEVGPYGATIFLRPGGDATEAPDILRWLNRYDANGGFSLARGGITQDGSIYTLGSLTASGPLILKGSAASACGA